MNCFFSWSIFNVFSSFFLFTLFPSLYHLRSLESLTPSTPLTLRKTVVFVAHCWSLVNLHSLQGERCLQSSLCLVVRALEAKLCLFVPAYLLPSFCLFLCLWSKSIVYQYFPNRQDLFRPPTLRRASIFQLWISTFSNLQPVQPAHKESRTHREALFYRNARLGPNRLEFTCLLWIPLYRSAWATST